MPVAYTFIKSRYENLLSTCQAILPGLDRAVIVYDGKSGMMIREAGKEDGQLSEFVTENKVHVYKKLNKLRGQASMLYEWLSPEEAPFENQEKGGAGSLDIFSENNNIVLLMRFPVPGSSLSDLIFLYLRPNLSNFGLSRVDKPLSTENKAITGHLYYSFLKHILYLNESNLGTYNSLGATTRSIITQHATHESEMKQIRHNYGESLINLCRKILDEYTEKTGIRYLLSDDAVQKISSYNGEIIHLEKILDNAITFVDNTYPAQGIQEKTIFSWFLDFDTEKYMQAEEHTGLKIDEKESRSMQLLDKLEKAARAVVANKGSLTGINVGNACPTPISAPAITDALKKHRKKILVLFDKYPERWNLIRTRFRPVMNLTIQKDRFAGEAAGW